MPLIPTGESLRRKRKCEVKEPVDAGRFVSRASSDSEKSNSGGRKHLVHKAVSGSSLGSVVCSVVEFDGKHDGRSARVAKNEVEVLLRDFPAVAAKPVSR